MNHKNVDVVLLFFYEKIQKKPLLLSLNVMFDFSLSSFFFFDRVKICVFLLRRCNNSWYKLRSKSKMPKIVKRWFKFTKSFSSIVLKSLKCFCLLICCCALVYSDRSNWKWKCVWSLWTMNCSVGIECNSHENPINIVSVYRII